MIEAVKQYLLSNWPLATSKKPDSPDNLWCVQKSGFGGSGATLVWLVYTAGSTSPVLVLKAARHVGRGEVLTSEYTNTTVIRERIVAAAATIPVPIFLRNFGADRVLCVTGLPGIPIGDSVSRRRFWKHTQDYLATVCEWATAFQKAQKAPLSELPSDGVVTEISRMEQTSVAPRWIQQAMKILKQRAVTNPTGKYVVHNDFWPSNILAQQGSITGVVDWQHACNTLSPLQDIIWFLFSHAMFVIPENKLNPWENLMHYCVEESELSRIARPILSQCCETLSVPLQEAELATVSCLLSGMTRHFGARSFADSWINSEFRQVWAAMLDSDNRPAFLPTA